MPYWSREHGDQNFALQFVFNRIPIDIEEVCVVGGLSILEHIKPPSIVAAHDPHVVGNDVEDLAHAMAVQFLNEIFVILWTTNFRVQRIVVDDVVAVQAAGPSARDKERRRSG